MENDFYSNTNSNSNIPKEILDQYPYGQFPQRYTRSGQEAIRKQSESRFSYTQEIQPQKPPQNLGTSLNSILPFIQFLSGGKKSQKDIMQLFSKIIFKDNPDMQKLFSLIPSIKGQDYTPQSDFPNTNKIEISSLKKIE